MAMDRRTFVRTTGASGALALAGCLGSDDNSGGEPIGDASPPRYRRPDYSDWPPAESYDGSVMIAHLHLGSLPAIHSVVSAGRLPTAHPLVGLPLHSIDRISTAVETLSSYPFSAPLRDAVNAAGTPDGETTTSGNDNETVVDPASDPLTESTNNTTSDSLTESTNSSAESTETAASEEPDPQTAAELGIELDSITLTDDVLLFVGSFDQPSIVERFTDSFEQVDTHRGLRIFEGTDDNAGLAFALSPRWLVVPVEDDTRAVESETVLAHSLSGYITTVGRIVDQTDGRWLFETTGSGPLSIGVWDRPNAADLLAEAGVSTTSREDLGAVFNSTGSFLVTLDPTVDSEQITAVQTRFSGLFPAGPPTDEELLSTLIAEADSHEQYSESPRVHVSAAFENL